VGRMGRSRRQNKAGSFNNVLIRNSYHRGVTDTEQNCLQRIQEARQQKEQNCLQRIQEARQQKEQNCLDRIKGFKEREKQLIKDLNDDCMKDIEKQYNIGFKEGYKQHKLDSIYKN
jgi:hypothetical protein